MHLIKMKKKQFHFIKPPGVCTNSTAPSVSSINRILRNRAAERAAAEFARAAGYAGLYHPYAFPWPAAAAAHLWSPLGHSAQTASSHAALASFAAASASAPSSNQTTTDLPHASSHSASSTRPSSSDNESPSIRNHHSCKFFGKTMRRLNSCCRGQKR
jgi:paired box protein 6